MDRDSKHHPPCRYTLCLLRSTLNHLIRLLGKFLKIAFFYSLYWNNQRRAQIVEGRQGIWMRGDPVMTREHAKIMSYYGKVALAAVLDLPSQGVLFPFINKSKGKGVSGGRIDGEAAAAKSGAGGGIWGGAGKGSVDLANCLFASEGDAIKASMKKSRSSEESIISVLNGLPTMPVRPFVVTSTGALGPWASTILSAISSSKRARECARITLSMAILHARVIQRFHSTKVFLGISLDRKLAANQGDKDGRSYA